MLRNRWSGGIGWCSRLLNEVLSLNAQESWPARRLARGPAFLNEVLSLNAQELPVVTSPFCPLLPQ